MLKNKLKVMLILLAIVTLISTLSFATDVSTDEILAEEANDSEEVVVENDLTDDDSEYVDDVDTTETDWVNEDLYQIGDKVVVDKVVDGNVYIMANEAVISSEIGGDVFVMAKKITVDGGYIYNNLYAMGQEVIIDGIVCDAYIGATNFTLSSNGYVYRDLRISADTINIEGRIRRNAFMAGNNINLSEKNGTLIGGNLEYTAKNEITVPEGLVAGEVTFNAEVVREVSVAEIVKNYVFDLANILIYTLVLAILSLWLAPKFVERVSAMGVGKAFTSLGIGAASIVIGFLGVIILMITTIASMLGVSILFIIIAICLSGTAFASIYFGSLFAKLLKWDGNVKFVIACVLAALAIWIITKIPFIGGFIGFLVALFGIGTLVVNTIVRKETKKEITIDPTEDIKAE